MMIVGLRQADAEKARFPIRAVLIVFLRGMFCCLSSPVVVVWAPCEIEAENNNLLRAARFSIAQQDRHEGTKVRT